MSCSVILNLPHTLNVYSLGLYCLLCSFHLKTKINCMYFLELFQKCWQKHIFPHLWAGAVYVLVSCGLEFSKLHTLLFMVPRRAALASKAAYVTHRPVERCCIKHMDSPYLISGIPIPSTSRFFFSPSTFSCSPGRREMQREKKSD